MDDLSKYSTEELISMRNKFMDYVIMNGEDELDRYSSTPFSEDLRKAVKGYNAVDDELSRRLRRMREVKAIINTSRSACEYYGILENSCKVTDDCFYL